MPGSDFPFVAERVLVGTANLRLLVQMDVTDARDFSPVPFPDRQEM
jgi:hypothetical protein